MMIDKFKDSNTNIKDRKSDIIEDMKLNLLVKNRIVFSKIIDRYLKIYKECDEKYCLTVLLKIIYYIWLIQNQNFLDLLRSKFEKRTYLSDFTLETININYSVKLKNRMHPDDMLEFSHHFKYIPNIHILDLQSITDMF